MGHFYVAVRGRSHFVYPHGHDFAHKRSTRQTKARVVGAVARLCMFIGMLSILTYVYDQHIFAIFTTKLKVPLEGAHSIWQKVYIYNFKAEIFGKLSGIATEFGMQWTLGVKSCVCLYHGISIPVTYYFTLVQREDIEAAWT